LNQSPKACEQCRSERIHIGGDFYALPAWRRYLGTLLVYVPLFVSVPFVILGSLIIYGHLRMLGARNIKGYWDFVPAWSTHRYAKLSKQITFKFDYTAPWLSMKLFWAFNCNVYCPLSVALYEWSAYLVKTVENFWCPFFHERKSDYAGSAIDQSFWHVLPENKAQLDPEDRDCAIWNEAVTKS
jgi:hypothetical protein